MKTIKNANAKEKGQTLIILLIAMAIALLLSLKFIFPVKVKEDQTQPTPSPVEMINKAKEVKCMNNLVTLRKAIEMYKIQEVDYPENLNLLYPNYISNFSFLVCPKTNEHYIFDFQNGRISCPTPEHKTF